MTRRTGTKFCCPATGCGGAAKVVETFSWRTCIVRVRRCQSCGIKFRTMEEAWQQVQTGEKHPKA